MAIDELRSIRKRLKLSLEEVANAVGISRQTLATIENGQSDPGISIIASLAKVYGYELELRFARSSGSRFLTIDLLGDKPEVDDDNSHESD